MMSHPLVSVVVPVYKVEKYLFRCVDSLLHQTLTEIQIILVDDGSPDRCGAICDEFSVRDSRVVTVHKENGGLPSARNAGIAVAVGEYIGFVDSDDWVSENMFRELYDNAKKVDADLAVCDYAIVSDTCVNISAMKANCEDIGEQLLYGVKPLACNKIFRRSCGLHFYEDLRFAEDRPTVISFLTRAKKFAYVPKPYYYYFQRSDSIADGYSKNASYLYDIRSMRTTIQDSAEKYRKQVVKYCVDVILWTTSNKPRSSCRAYMIEFLQELSPLINQNRFLQDVKGLTPLLTQETIPLNLVYWEPTAESEWTEAQRICWRSWDHYASELRRHVLNETNCDIEKAPDCVQEAYRKKRICFVSDYFRLRFIYEHGGIAVDVSIRLNAPPGELRATGTFFGYRNREEINSGIFGSVPKAEVLKDILDTYESNSILNDSTDWKLSDRIQSVLKQYGLKEDGNGHTQILKNGIHLYSCNVLSYAIGSEGNAAQIFDDLCLAAERKGLQLVPAAVFNSFTSISESRINKPGIQYEVKRLQTEVERLKNSRSWKITRPLRKLCNFFRKVKYSEKEIQ